MKIHLENIGEIIDHAFFEQNNKCLSLYINTKHKGVWPEHIAMYGGGVQYCLATAIG